LKPAFYQSAQLFNDFFREKKNLISSRSFFLSKNEKNCDPYCFWKFQAALGSNLITL